VSGWKERRSADIKEIEMTVKKRVVETTVLYNWEGGAEPI
jgi:hypothetical protein